MPGWSVGAKGDELTRLQELYIPSLLEVDLKGLLCDPALENLCIVSFFSAESAALLHFVSRERPGFLVLFLVTGKHFAETLAYRDEVSALLDLNLVILRPEPATLKAADPAGDLHAQDPNNCCTIRKTFPLKGAMKSYDGWGSGLKRFQGATHSTLPLIERDGEKIKVNRLALWEPHEIKYYFRTHALPRHPLMSKGYTPIGCAPCSRAVRTGEDLRARRWPKVPDKTECGIHLGPDRRFARTSRNSD
ncbi:phosphoadenylyl-sulfate reductase [Roseovarius sp.]|uniref:phosphoadenylyl-sulfate reductase n=1 Tax=Roseovarius sp. TaxID=1486281 RepID=UPI00351781BE